jgi:hypothetical protein
MLSMTGYFRDGSKFDGRMMIPQMSVTPSRPFAVNTSGAFQPDWVSPLMSARSISATRLPSASSRSSLTGGVSSRE